MSSIIKYNLVKTREIKKKYIKFALKALYFAVAAKTYQQHFQKVLRSVLLTDSLRPTASHRMDLCLPTRSLMGKLHFPNKQHRSGLT